MTCDLAVHREGDVPYARRVTSMSCASCAADIPDGSKFCASCGVAVAGTGSVSGSQPEQRRFVTVLFADLVGFTTLAEQLDPEQAKRMIDSCFARLVDDVVAFGGRVDKILGDGILALFGAPVAHEDDPERAVRAALRMQRSLDEHVAARRRIAGASPAFGADLRMRIGINTGEVLVGSLAGGDYTAMGDVVNLASRLQAEAPPGKVLVGATTYALTSHAVRYEPAGELVARGREHATSAWIPIEATALPGARRRRGDVAMVGRRAELDLGRAALELATGVGTTQHVLISICGESGVGKSRLVDELLNHVRETADAVVLEGACVPYGEANVWWPIASALATFLGLEHHPTLDAVRELAMERAAHFAPHADDDERERVVEVFAHLFGHPSAIDRLDPPNARAAVHRAVSKLLELSTHKRPTVLSLDDLHWADPKLIDLLTHLVRALARHRFALVTAERPGGENEWPPRAERVSMIALNLQPLTRDETQHLAADLLPDHASDSRLLANLYERSGGNPLFLRELAALADTGAPEREVPDSLRSLIGARLDTLTIPQRQLLDNAAVLGTSGSTFGLEKFAEAMNQRYSTTTLVELDDLDLLEVHGSRWEFRSDSVREAVYQTLTKALRAERHAGVAFGMRHAHPSALDDLAHHAATAAELVRELGPVSGVPSNIATQAVSLLRTATERANQSGSLNVAVRHATRAIDLLPADGTAGLARAELRLLRGTALVEQRAYAPAHADLEAALDFATADDTQDVAMEGAVRQQLGSLHQAEGRPDLARVELGAAVEVLRSVERPDLLADALRARGFIELFGGSLVDAEWFLGEADAIFTDLGDERGMAWVEQHRAWISFLSGDMDAARIRLRHAAETMERIGDRNGVGWAFGLLAFVEFFQRNLDEAESLAALVEGEAEERGDTWAGAMMKVLLSNMRLWAGRLEEAISLADDARARFRALDDAYGTMQTLTPMLRAQIALGRTAAAQRTMEELMMFADTSSVGPLPLIAVAGAAMHRGDAATTINVATRALAEVAASGGDSNEAKISLAMGLAQAGRIDEALAALETASTFTQYAEHPFTASVASVIHALVDDAPAAMRAAQIVERDTGASYLDRVLAAIGTAAAHDRLGDHDAAERAANLAVRAATDAGDVVATALAARFYLRLTGRTHPADDERAQLADGWVTVLDSLVGAHA